MDALWARATVRKLLSSESDDDRANAAVQFAAWKRYHPRAPADVIVPGLIKALRDSQPGVRGSAAHALGDYPAERVRVTSPLMRCLGDPEPRVRKNAIDSLGTIRAEESVKAIIGFLKDKDPQIRISAIIALARIGPPAASEAVPSLKTLLTDPECSGFASDAVRELSRRQPTAR